MRFRHLWTEPDAPRFIPVLAPWVYAASQPFADWYFAEGDVAAEIIAEWMGRPTSEVSVERAIVMATTDADPVGCLIGIGGAELARCRAADLAAFCADLGTGPDAEAALELVIGVSRELFPPVAEDELYISRVTIDPSRRGNGLGRALVAHAVETYREQGFRSFRLDVCADNRAAIRCYEAAGFKVISTSHSDTADLAYSAMTLG